MRLPIALLLIAAGLLLMWYVLINRPLPWEQKQTTTSNQQVAARTRQGGQQ